MGFLHLFHFYDCFQSGDQKIKPNSIGHVASFVGGKNPTKQQPFSLPKSLVLSFEFLMTFSQWTAKKMRNENCDCAHVNLHHAQIRSLQHHYNGQKHKESQITLLPYRDQIIQGEPVALRLIYSDPLTNSPMTHFTQKKKKAPKWWTALRENSVDCNKDKNTMQR